MFEVSRSDIVRTDKPYYVNAQSTGLISLEALSPTQEYRGYIEIPSEIRENTDTPLKFNILLQKNKEDNGLEDEIYTNFIYFIR